MLFCVAFLLYSVAAVAVVFVLLDASHTVMKKRRERTFSNKISLFFFLFYFHQKVFFDNFLVYYTPHVCSVFVLALSIRCLISLLTICSESKKKKLYFHSNL